MIEYAWVVICLVVSVAGRLGEVESDERGSSWSRDELVLDHGVDYFMRDVVRASTAAPGIISAAKVTSIPGARGTKKTRYLIDGGVVAKNPILWATLGLVRQGLVAPDFSDLSVLSVGTGAAIDSLEGNKNHGIIRWLEALLSILIQAKSSMEHALLDDFFYRSLNWEPYRYLRLQKSFDVRSSPRRAELVRALRRFDDTRETTVAKLVDLARLSDNEQNSLRNYVRRFVFDNNTVDPAKQLGICPSSTTHTESIFEGKLMPNVTLGVRRDIYRLLSIDGGGVLGVISAIALVELEDEIRKQIKALHGNDIRYEWEFPVDLADYFDCFAGSSSGSILATFFASRGAHSYANIIVGPGYDREIYKRARQTTSLPLYQGSAESALANFIVTGPKIFPPRPWYQPEWLNLGFRPLYLSSGMDTVLRDAFGDMKISELQSSVIVPTYCISDNTPFVFFHFKSRDNDVSSFGSLSVRREQDEIVEDLVDEDSPTLRIPPFFEEPTSDFLQTLIAGVTIALMVSVLSSWLPRCSSNIAERLSLMSDQAAAFYEAWSELVSTTSDPILSLVGLPFRVSVGRSRTHKQIEDERF
uniref:PNPLA domain-containing protein n=1 Tax=Compsopogon caeruleus TaxID=31354 RepID=A0A7S1TH97_9RHOD|mmetsp:Transcript_7547/g.15350  ORF Transcript_7547/g.15350 Transcript_7547/m.15350 type:complete len:586 (+) Transcript_7547:228-1985(+)